MQEPTRSSRRLPVCALREGIRRTPPLYVNAARWRLGAMLGGDEGDALRREAQEFFGARGVARSQQLIDAIMPGWGRG